MIPTIDISVFAWVTVIATYIRVAWNYLQEGLNWFVKRSVGLFLGSKFWGLFFFLAVFGLILTACTKILNIVNTFVLSVAIGSVTSASGDVLLFAKLLRVKDLISLISIGVSTLEIFLVVEHSVSVQKLIASALKQFSASWKL